MKKHSLLFTYFYISQIFYNDIRASQPAQQVARVRRKCVPNAIVWGINNNCYTPPHTFRNQDGESLLHVACRARDKKAIAALLDVGVDVDTKTTYGKNTPLHTACSHGNAKIVLFLLENSFTHALNKTNEFSLTPLNLACLHKHTKTVKALLKHRSIDVNEADSDHSTPLHNAVENGCNAIVSLLLGHKKIDPNITNSLGNTPLHNACYTNNLTAIAMLLDHKNITLDISNVAGVTAFTIASQHNDKKIMQEFIKYNFLKTLFSSQNITPLSLRYKATKKNYTKVSLKPRKDSEPTLIVVKTKQ